MQVTSRQTTQFTSQSRTSSSSSSSSSRSSPGTDIKRENSTRGLDYSLQARVSVRSLPQTGPGPTRSLTGFGSAFLRFYVYMYSFTSFVTVLWDKETVFIFGLTRSTAVSGVDLPRNMIRPKCECECVKNAETYKVAAMHQTYGLP